MCAVQEPYNSTAPAAPITGTTNSVDGLCAFWERQTRADACFTLIARPAASSEDIAAVDAHALVAPVAPVALVATSIVAPACGLPDFHIAAFLFIAMVLNWLAGQMPLGLDAPRFVPRILVAIVHCACLTSALLQGPTRVSLTSVLPADHASSNMAAIPMCTSSPDTLKPADFDTTTNKTCVLVWSSMGSYQQKSTVNCARDILADLAIDFVQVDVPTTTMPRMAFDLLMHHSCLPRYNIPYPLVFTGEMDLANGFVYSAKYIPFEHLELMQSVASLPLGDAATKGYLPLTPAIAFAGVPTRKSLSAREQECLSLTTDVLITRTVVKGLFLNWRAETKQDETLP